MKINMIPVFTALLALPFFLAAADSGVMLETFQVTPDKVVAFTGDSVDFKLEYKSTDGSTLYAWFAPIERRSAPEAFFKNTKRAIKKHASNPLYDNISLVPYHLTKNPSSMGTEHFSLALYDFEPGHYKFYVNAKFMKAGTQHTRVLEIPIEVKKPVPPERPILPPGKQAVLADYIIYYAEDATPSIKKAAMLLQEFLFKASGVRLPFDSNPVSPFIAVGTSEAAVKAGIDAERIPYDGYVLKNNGNDIFIVGREMPDDGVTPDYGRSYGTTFGVNAFLEHYLGISWLLPGERGLYIPPITKNHIFGNIDEAYAPRFNYRLLWVRGGSKAVSEWMSFNQTPLNHYGSRYFGSPHAWIWLYPEASMPQAAVVPDRETTFKQNPEFFELSTDGRRVSPSPGESFSLCLGNPATTEDIIQRIPKLSALTWQRYPHMKGLKFQSLTPNDNAPYCACNLCSPYRREVKEEDTGLVSYKLPWSWTELVFNHIRTVCERLPDYQFAAYIYHSTQFPYPGVKPMPKNFTATMAPLHCGYGPVRYCDGINATWHRWMNSWDGIFAEQSYYGLDFWIRQYYGAPLPPCIRLMKETFAEILKRPFTGVMFYDNPGYGQSGMSTWILTKMMWNPSLNPEKLAEEFLVKAYGEKASVRMAMLYQIVEEQTRKFYNMYNGRYGWDMDAEMLTDLYAPIFPEMEELFLAATANAGNENQKWRLEMFGENLKLLRYTLISLGLMQDSDSPLRLDTAGFDKLNRSRLPGGELVDYLSPPVKPIAATVDANVKAEITDDLKGQEKYLPFSCQAHREFLIIPRQDGFCELEIEGFTMRRNEVKGRNYLPQIQAWSVYHEDNSLYLSGMATNGLIRFPVEKGKLYRFCYTPVCDFAIRPYWYLKRCSEPYAIGHHDDGEGFRFYDIKSPLWFYVEPGTGAFDIHLSCTYVNALDVDLRNPDGKLIASVHRENASTDILSAPEKPAPGWWKLEFTSERGYCGYLRLGTGLTGYAVTDPEMALKVMQK